MCGPTPPLETHICGRHDSRNFSRGSHVCFPLLPQLREPSEALPMRDLLGLQKLKTSVCKVIKDLKSHTTLLMNARDPVSLFQKIRGLYPMCAPSPKSSSIS